MHTTCLHGPWHLQVCAQGTTSLWMGLQHEEQDSHPQTSWQYTGLLSGPSCGVCGSSSLLQPLAAIHPFKSSPIKSGWDKEGRDWLLALHILAALRGWKNWPDRGGFLGTGSGRASTFFSASGVRAGVVFLLQCPSPSLLNSLTPTQAVSPVSSQHSAQPLHRRMKIESSYWVILPLILTDKFRGSDLSLGWRATWGRSL